jgi:integration host factor subunit alpha
MSRCFSIIRTMSGNTVTRADLCEAIYKKVRLSRSQSAKLVEHVLKEITECLERGETVKLSSFGLFVMIAKVRTTRQKPGLSSSPIARRSQMRCHLSWRWHRAV